VRRGGLPGFRETTPGDGTRFNDVVQDNPPPCTGEDVDPEWFFYDTSGQLEGVRIGERRGYTALAKEVCNQCGVKSECLEYAMSFESQGVWGGLTTAERIKLGRKAPLEVAERTTPTL